MSPIIVVTTSGSSLLRTLSRIFPDFLSQAPQEVTLPDTDTFSGHTDFLVFSSNLKKLTQPAIIITDMPLLPKALQDEDIASPYGILGYDLPESACRGLCLRTDDAHLHEDLPKLTRGLAELPTLAPPFHAFTDPVLVYTSAGAILSANPAAEDLGLRAQETLPDTFSGDLCEALTSNSARNFPVTHANIAYSLTCIPRGLFGLALLHDTTELQEAKDVVATMQKQSKELVSFDHLTGVGNRTLFEDIIGSALERERPFGLILLDLDKFKQVNDQLGHHVGDLVIAEIAQRITPVLPEHTQLFRLGGDEFGIVAFLGVEECALLCDKVLECFASVSPNTHKPLSASLGLACYPMDAKTLKDVYTHADEALYQAKNAGKGIWMGYNPDVQLSTEDTLLPLLRQAIRKGDIYLHFQAIVDTADWDWKGVEVLARWTLPDHGVIPPGIFIPLAEKNNLMPALGDLITAKAIQALCEMRAEGFDLPFSLNVSKAQLHSNYAVTLADQVQKAGLLPSDFMLELTESLSFAEPEQALQLILDLQAKGFKVSLDDFGTGFNSIELLAELPVDQIKLSKTVVDQFASKHYNALLRCLVALANETGVELVAEGIESNTLALCLQIMGVHQLQGFYFSYPSSQEVTLKAYQALKADQAKSAQTCALL
jgi:diguanylate cyclase (GGDEF)-like protein